MVEVWGLDILEVSMHDRGLLRNKVSEIMANRDTSVSQSVITHFPYSLFSLIIIIFINISAENFQGKHVEVEFASEKGP
jgi:hypothetical protein